MIALDPTASHLVITNHLLEALLTDRAEREMVVKQPSQQLPPVTVKTLLKLGMFQASSVGPVHEADQRLELLTTRSEPIRRRPAGLAAGVAAHFDCTIITTAPELQDFAHRRVNFTSTGVENGGHVWPPPWSTKDMNNADFDTLLMTPRPPPGPQTTPPPNPTENPNPPASANPGAGKPPHTANL